ncbi:Putative membrane protein [Kitasatospora sp. MMS16-BH015]|uniref:FtsX-like permease family protein n=1 Tax=Kitasatospora sp. MMS16-BH015 TaxID=2018025 RepID=UPI000CA1768E|nr:FtsX-like permease family protein [Kitasatospora sp. MMS16-BH015]AUG79570.1 Putative membrane protein [Kitasatospora sp. MMS16-BH015]
MSLSSWRLALRIARRDALRAKGRSALVLAMIALPVLGVTGADIVYRSGQLDPGERVARVMGGADALVSVYQRGDLAEQAPDYLDGRTGSSPEPGKPLGAEQRRSLATEPATLLGELLPAGSRLVPVQGGGTFTTTREGQLRVATAEADLTDPVWRGKLDLVEGKAPATDREVAATRHFLDQAGLRIGDTTTPREGHPYTVTGVVENPAALDEDTLVGRPGALLPAPAGGESARGADTWLAVLPAGAVLDWPKVLELNKYGITASSRAVLLDPPARAEVPFYQGRAGTGDDRLENPILVITATVAGMALLEIVLLAGPAFAVGARRSRRQLGLLAAAGGDRSQVRAVVLGGGAVLGAAGAVLGVVLAVGLVAVGRPWAEQRANSRFGHFDLHALDLLGIALIGLVTGLLAAVVPAVQAARQDVVEALDGRGTVKPANRRLALLGLVMLIGGTALALGGQAVGQRTVPVLGGSMIAELGMVALTPILVGLFGRLGRWLPLSPRLALRDAVRHRGRTAPAVAAVMAAVAGSVAVGIYTTSNDQAARERYEARMPNGAVSLSFSSRTEGAFDAARQRAAVEQAAPGLGERGDVASAAFPADCNAGKSCGYVEAVLPKEQRCPAYEVDSRRTDPAEYDRLRRDPRCTHQPNYTGQFGATPIGGAAVLRNLFGAQDRAAEGALAAGKAVVFDARYLTEGQVTLRITDPWPEGGPTVGPDGSVVQPKEPASHEVRVDAVVAAARVQAAPVLLGDPAARQLGLARLDAGSVWLPPAAPDGTAEQRVTSAVAKLDPGSRLEVERGYRSSQGLISVGLTVFAALVALGAAGIATGLAAADSQRDLATLAAVGATGGIRRRLSGFQCGVIAAMGAALGTVCGVVPAVALRKVEALAASGTSTVPGSDEVVIAFPWATMGVTLLLLPAVAVLLATLLTRSRLSLVRREA